MKTKLQFLVSIASLVAFTTVSNAKVLSLNDSHINAILNTPNTLQTVNSISIADIDRTDVILNATSDKIVDNTTSDLSVDSYHHGGGSSGSSERHYYVNLGVGFVLGISSGVFTDQILGTGNGGSGGSLTYSPAIGYYISSERAFGDNVAVGAFFEYQTCTATYNYTASVFTGYDVNGNPVYTNTSYSDKAGLYAYAFALKITYNFTMSNEKLDPYVSLLLGYCIGVWIDQVDNSNVGAYGGGVIGLCAGIRYWFVEHLGVWGELGYTTGGGYTLVNLGLAIKI